jgi:SAM-dependent methyltransferase
MERCELLTRHLKPGWAGIEIGACHQPIPLPPDIRIQYVDRLSQEALTQAYRNSPTPLNHVVDDGETLLKFRDSSQHFVLTSHVLEHAKDPIGMLETWMRVLKPGGIIAAAVPLKDECFDRHRQAVSLDHLLDCHLDPFDADAHYREYLSKVDNLTGDALEAAIRLNIETDYNIHFHAFNEASWDQLFACVCGLSFTVLERERAGHELLWVLQKNSAPSC